MVNSIRSVKRIGGTPYKKSGLARAVATAAAMWMALGFTNAATGDAGSPPTTGTKAGFNGTAYLKTTNTVWLDNKSYGLARAAGQGLVDQCNVVRKMYDLPPVSPPESVMALLDVATHEKFFDTNKALTLITGHVADLPEVQRWIADSKAIGNSGKLPAVPPDCSKLKAMEIRSGTLWRDGVIYALRYDTSKAIGRKVTARPPPAGFKAAFDAAVPTLVLGQTCREIVGTADMAPGSRSCIWDLFPYVSYLNWPFALSGRAQFGPIPGMFETIVPVTIEHDRAIPASTFEIPPGFTVVPP